MGYPHIFLTRPIRRIIMIGFFGLFFVLAPAIILYTEGYRYNWSLHRVEETGVISIDATPLDATVVVNGITIKNKLPIRLPNRAPGTYHIIIEKSGYHTWEKDITVSSKQTTYVKSIELYRDTPPTPIATSANLVPALFAPSADGAYGILVSDQNQVREISLYHTGTGQSTSVARFPTSTRVLADWSPFGSTATIQTTDAHTTALQIFDPATEELGSKQTISLQESSPLLWSRSGQPGILVKQKNQIKKITLAGVENIGTLATTTAWFVDSRSIVWYLDTTTHRLIPLASGITPIAVPDNTDIVSIVDINDHRAILQAPDRLLVIARDPNTTPAVTELANVLHTRYSGATDEWLAWSSVELSSIYADGSIALLDRTSEQMNAIVPLDAHGVLLVATDKSLTAFNPGYFVSQTLLAADHIERVAVDAQDRKIIFLGTVHATRGLYELPY